MGNKQIKTIAYRIKIHSKLMCQEYQETQAEFAKNWGGGDVLMGIVKNTCTPVEAENAKPWIVLEVCTAGTVGFNFKHSQQEVCWGQKYHFERQCQSLRES